NGDYIFWVINSKVNSDLWGTAIIPSRSPEVEYSDSGLTAFLESLLANRVKYKSFPDSFPPDVIKFETI
ncbi:SMI1/KNR4 family protein, partial [Escherichia marmotae]|nr:SMI1/KNR4 family protein [Escherichia marmotae]